MTSSRDVAWAYEQGVEAGRAAVLAEQEEAARVKTEKMKLDAERFADVLFKNSREESHDQK